MSTKLFRIEILIAGFFHLIWMTFLALCIMGKSADVIYCFITTMQSGSALVFSPILIGVSYYLGILAEHFISAIIYFFGDKNKIINNYKGSPDEVYANKIFFVSLSIAVAIVIYVLLINTFNCCKLFWVILVIGGIIELGNVISAIYWIDITKRKQMVLVITRKWHGITKIDYADEYLKFLETTGILEYKRIKGNLSAEIWRRKEENVCHFWTVTKWNSIDSIKIFAGEQYKKACYFQEDKKYLLEFEEKVSDYETFVY